jgi:hypothetical protein
MNLCLTFYVVNSEFKIMWKAYLTQYPSICLGGQIKIKNSVSHDINPTQMSKYKDSHTTFLFLISRFTPQEVQQTEIHLKMQSFGLNNACTERSF